MPVLSTLLRIALEAARLRGGLLSALLTTRSRRANTVTWDSDTARFRVEGRTVPITRIRAELDRLESLQLYRMRGYNQKYWSRQWTIEKWRRAMIREMEETHTLAGALATGSIRDAAEDETVQRRIERDTQAVNRFAADILRQKVSSRAQADNRVRAYTRSPQVTFELLFQRENIRAGMTEARRRLSAAEHCRSKAGVEGCLEAAQRGWMPIRDMPPKGTLVCKQFCKCWIEYRRGGVAAKEDFSGSVVRNEDGSLKTMYHGSNSRIEEFDLSKVREYDLDAPFNGFWFSNTREGASPALRDPSFMHEVHLNIQNPITRAELYAMMRQEESLRNLSGSEMRLELQRRGYDGVAWRTTPEIDIEAFNREGVVEFRNEAGNRRMLRLDAPGDVGYYRLSDVEWDYITGYESAEKFLDVEYRDEIYVAFRPEQIRVNKITDLR